MPIDPSIALGVQMPQIDPMRTLAGVQQFRMMQENARALQEQRQAMAEQRRMQTEALRGQQIREQRLQALFSGETMPSESQILAAAGPEDGTKIIAGLRALKTQDVKSYGELQNVVGSTIGAIGVLPEAMRPQAYDLAVKSFATKGWIAPEQVQPYSPESLAYYQRWAMTPKEQWEIDNPKPVEVGGALVSVKPGQKPTEIYRAPEKKAFQSKEMLVGGRPAVVNFDPASGKYFDAKGAEVADVRPIPPQAQPTQPSYSRAEVTDTEGNTVLANYDARSGQYFDVNTGKALKGISGAPTAEQKNKAAAKALVLSSINAVKAYSDRVLTRVGPAQRAEAIKRGAEAVFGNDPEFRTYQDSRTALAGNLAVAQQGSRPSDADIKSIWLPLVPDPYRDTAESARMKWELIQTMSVPTKKAQGGNTKDPMGIR